MTASFPPFVQGLCGSRAYPHRPRRVRLLQTHASFIFLAGNLVYKVKKPVNFGFLDFSSLEKRRFYCQEEVRLNQRLCPETYLGVVEVVEDPRGFAVERPGRLVDYAVKMRRLPESRMLYRLLARDQVSEAMLQRLARRLADFHTAAEGGPAIDRFGTPELIAVNTEENFAQTRGFIGETLSRAQFDEIVTYTRAFLAEQRDLLQRRIAEGRIRDCHGDLHAENICFVDGLCIYDCIEFNERFRYGDIASEIAFLAMDLDHRGRPDLSQHFVESYITESGDSDLAGVLNFYKCYRAYVRGKVESFRLAEPEVPETARQRAKRAATAYFRLAHSYIHRLARPTLFITCGLIGVGKSSFAKALAHRLSIDLVSSDAVRKELAGLPPTERQPQPFGEGIYSPEFTQRTYEALIEWARPKLQKGRSVVLDAGFRTRAARQFAVALAAETGADLWILEFRAHSRTVRWRLERRQQEPSISDAHWELFPEIKAEFEPVDEVPSRRHLVLNTLGSLESCVEQVVERVMAEERRLSG